MSTSSSCNDTPSFGTDSFTEPACSALRTAGGCIPHRSGDSTCKTRAYPASRMTSAQGLTTDRDLLPDVLSADLTRQDMCGRNHRQTDCMATIWCRSNALRVRGHLRPDGREGRVRGYPRRRRRVPSPPVGQQVAVAARADAEFAVAGAAAPGRQQEAGVARGRDPAACGSFRGTGSMAGRRATTAMAACSGPRLRIGMLTHA